MSQMLTKKQRGEIVGHLRMGVPRTTAAEVLGVTDAALFADMKADPAFAADVKAAEATALTLAVGLVHKAAIGRWDAAQWWLERRDQLQPKEPGANETAARTTIAAMTADGKLGGTDDALVVAFLSLARSVDAKPGNANLWRQYLDAAKALRGVHDGNSDQAGLGQLLARLHAPVGDAAEPGPDDAGRPGGGNRRGARDPADAVAAPRRRRRTGAAG